MSRSSLKLPSWVPDWRFLGGMHAFSNFSVYQPGLRRYAAAEGSEPSVELSDDLHHVLVTGARVDKIVGVTPAWIFRTQNDLDHASLEKGLLDQEATAMKLIPQLDTIDGSSHNTEESRKYTRTIFADSLSTRTGFTFQDPVALYQEVMKILRINREDGHKEDASFSGESKEYVQSLANLWERQLCITEKGRLALVPSLAQVGDSICIFFGGPAPFIVRVDDMDDTHILIAEAYVDGIMDGGAIDEEDFCPDITKLR